MATNSFIKDLMMTNNGSLKLLIQESPLKIIQINNPSEIKIFDNAYDIKDIEPQKTVEIINPEIKTFFTENNLIPFADMLIPVYFEFKSKFNNSEYISSTNTIIKYKDSKCLLSELKVLEKPKEKEVKVKLQKFLDTCDTWHIETDRDFYIIFSNKKIVDFLDLSIKDIIGTSIFSIFLNNNNYPNLSKVLNLIQEQAPFKDYKVEIKKNDGNSVMLNANGLPQFDDTNQFTGYLLAFQLCSGHHSAHNNETLSGSKTVFPQKLPFTSSVSLVTDNYINASIIEYSALHSPIITENSDQIQPIAVAENVLNKVTTKQINQFPKAEISSLDSINLKYEPKHIINPINEKLNVLICEDHTLTAKLLENVLNSSELIKSTRVIDDGKQLMDTIAENHFDVVLLDIIMPELDGLKALLTLKKNHPFIKVIMLSSYDDSGIIKKALNYGADGYLTKKADLGEVVNAISIAISGGAYLCKNALNSISATKIMHAEEEIDKTQSYNKEKNNFDQLTAREIEILKHISNGLSSSDISRKMYISKRTVDTHRRNILKKFGENNFVSIIKDAIEKNMIE